MDAPTAGGNYSPNNPSVKRILREMKEMEKDTSDEYHARATEDNIFEWHFTVRGPKGTAFEGGIYHGRILLPAEYPFKPPNIIWLTPNGRFEVGTKICLTISAHHPEHWQPSWSIRTALVALIGFLPTPGEGALGALDFPAEERRALAKQSVKFCCPKCGPISHILPPLSTSTDESSAPGSPMLARASSTDNEAEPQRNEEAEAEVQEFGGPGAMMGGVGVRHNQRDQPNPAPPQRQQQQQQADHDIEGPAKLLNYVIIALFFAIIAIVLRKISTYNHI